MESWLSWNLAKISYEYGSTKEQETSSRNESVVTYRISDKKRSHKKKKKKKKKQEWYKLCIDIWLSREKAIEMVWTCPEDGSREVPYKVLSMDANRKEAGGKI